MAISPQRLIRSAYIAGHLCDSTDFLLRLQRVVCSKLFHFLELSTALNGRLKAGTHYPFEPVVCTVNRSDGPLNS